jgi:soluble lytic murein transglycosylase
MTVHLRLVRRAVWLVLTGFAVLFSQLAAADSADLEQQRRDFLAAEAALARSDMVSYQQLLAGLTDYPLYPYLHYEFLRRRLTRADAAQINSFIDKNSGTPIGAKMQHQWLTSLAHQRRWPEYLEAYRPSNDIALQCYYREALYRHGNKVDAFADLDRLWLVGYSQPRACDPLFTAWEKEGELTPDLAWRRIKLAMSKRKTSLAQYLSQFLSPEDRRWAELWIEVHRKPELILSTRRFAADHPIRSTILIYGLKQIARRDPAKAIDIWDNRLSTRYRFSEDEYADVERHLAMALAIQGRPEALSWLSVIEADPEDNSLREWRVRASIEQENWHAALAWIYQLTEEEQSSSRWRYWHARALESLNQNTQAEETYVALAEERSYYGFLAADRLDLPYQLNHQPLPEEIGEAIDVESYPGLQRARELYLLGRIVDARREWYQAIDDMAGWQLASAASMAHSWGWHDRAIMTMANTDERDDLDLRFPTVHLEQVLSEANIRNVDPALAFAVIRQESAFTADARSHAGAIGLMQLMPRTARRVAKRINMASPSANDLIDINTNLQLGIAHLRENLVRYGGNAVLATAAYNAGQSRVNQWIPQDSVVMSDVWAETIPFSETRQYVQNVMAFTAIYENRLGRKTTPLAVRMPPVAPLGAALSRRSQDKEAGPLSDDADPS